MKQYPRKVVENVIYFMAQSSLGLLSKKSTYEKLDKIPEEFHNIILASLLAARETKKLANIMAKTNPTAFTEED